MYAEPGYLLHSKPVLYMLALQNGRSSTCLLRLPILLCFPARARQPGKHQVSAVSPWSSCPQNRGRDKYWALAPVPLAKSRGKITEVNLQVSKVCLAGFFPPLFYCISYLLFLFTTGLAKVPPLQLKLCPVTELHIGFAQFLTCMLNKN